MRQAFDAAIQMAGIDPHDVRGVGLDTPGPASANGVISARSGATNFSDPEWHGFDIRAALEHELGLPVIYNNDGNAAALYAHHAHFGAVSAGRSSVSAIVGTGLGGGVVEARPGRQGRRRDGRRARPRAHPDGRPAGAGPADAALQLRVRGDVESVASLTGIRNNLLPYWLTRYPGPPAGTDVDPPTPRKQVRGYGEQGDEMALRIFDQQAMAIGRMFTIAANFTDPDAYFIGGGVIEAAPEFRDWFRDRVLEHTQLRDEQAAVAKFALVADLDMAGARGAAIAALSLLVHKI